MTKFSILNKFFEDACNSRESNVHVVYLLSLGNSPRWIVGQNSLRWLKWVYSPLSILGKIQLRLFSWFIVVKLLSILGVVKRVSVSIPENIVPEGFDFVISIGNNPVAPKYIFFLIKEGDVRSSQFLKLGITEQSRADIKYEVDILNDIKEGLYMPLNGLSFPKVLDVEIAENVAYFKMENVVSENLVTTDTTIYSPQSLFEVIERFSSGTSSNSTVADFIENCPIWEAFSSHHKKDLYTLFSKKYGVDEVALCFNHGDLTPWNIVLDDHGQAYVFDLEDGSLKLPSSYDFCYYYWIYHKLTKKMSDPENLQITYQLLSALVKDQRQLRIALVTCYIRSLKQENKAPDAVINAIETNIF